MKGLNKHLRLQVGIAFAPGGSAALFMLSAVRITHVYYVRVLVMSARNGLHTTVTKAVCVTSSVSNPGYVSLISMGVLLIKGESSNMPAF